MIAIKLEKKKNWNKPDSKPVKGQKVKEDSIKNAFENVKTAPEKVEKLSKEQVSNCLYIVKLKILMLEMKVILKVKY